MKLSMQYLLLNEFCQTISDEIFYDLSTTDQKDKSYGDNKLNPYSSQ